MYSPAYMKKLPFKTFRHALTVPAVNLVVFAAAALPRPVSRACANILGWFLSVLPLPSNKVIGKHRTSVMSSNGIQLKTAKIYSSVISAYFDFFYLSYRSDKAFKKIVKIQGADNMKKALSHGNGVVAVTAHFGAWELLPRAIKLLNLNIGVIGRSVSLPGAAAVLDKLRQKPGIETIDRDAGIGSMLRLLRKNGVLGMLIDQDTKGVQSIFADFLGHPARTPVAPAAFSRKLNAPVVTMHITRQADSTYLLVIDEPLFCEENHSPTDILTILNERIGEWILDAPEQWVWFHNRWRRQPELSEKTIV